MICLKTPLVVMAAFVYRTDQLFVFFLIKFSSHAQLSKIQEIRNMF